MRRFIASMAVVSVAFGARLAPLHACGEKLLVLGRGIRFQSRHTPRAASVLLYLPRAGSAQSLSDPHLESALRDAGHAVHAVTTNAELDTALRSGLYDVVLANMTDVDDLNRARATAASNAVVLPAVYLVAPPQAKQQARSDRAKAAQEFNVVVEVPGRPGQYCAAVDKAMDLKLKREGSIAHRP